MITIIMKTKDTPFTSTCLCLQPTTLEGLKIFFSLKDSIPLLSTTEKIVITVMRGGDDNMHR